VKKKYSVTFKEEADWFAFTKILGNIHDKDADFVGQNIKTKKLKKLDLHRCSLSKANKLVKKFILKSFEKGYKKLLIITGKGLRSKVHKNPYLSEKMNVLKYSVPDFIKNDEDLFNKINSISTASLRDGGEGAFYVFLRKKNL
jgi:DNA-nicking Smr family endonuclease